MVSGDREASARRVGDALGINEVYAEVSPERKQELVKAFHQRGKGLVVFAGDGINDAPALAAADVGVAMGTGADIAMESSGIVLVGGNLNGLLRAVHLSRAVLRNIKGNLFWAFFYNGLGIPLAAGLFTPWLGWSLNPMFAGVAMCLSSISVVGNALRLRKVQL